MKEGVALRVVNFSVVDTGHCKSMKRFMKVTKNYRFSDVSKKKGNEIHTIL